MKSRALLAGLLALAACSSSPPPEVRPGYPTTNPGPIWKVGGVQQSGVSAVDLSTGLTCTLSDGTLICTTLGGVPVPATRTLTWPSFLLCDGAGSCDLSADRAITLDEQVANQLFAGPTSGADATPTFRNMVAADLPTSTATVGSFGTATQVGFFTVDAHGILTASGNTAIQIAESQVTSLVSDLAAKLPLAGGTMTGALLFTDNTLDIGALGATRPRTLYAGTSVLTPAFDRADAGALTFGATNATSTAIGKASITNTVGAFTFNSNNITIQSGSTLQALLGTSNFSAYLDLQSGTWKLGSSSINVLEGTSTYTRPSTDLALILGDATHRWKRHYLAGTAHVTGDWGTLTGWGTGATVSSVSGNDPHHEVTVTAGTTPAASPTLTLTFKDATWTTSPWSNCKLEATSDATVTAPWVTSTTTATTEVVTFRGTPVDTKTYTVRCFVTGG